MMNFYDDEDDVVTQQTSPSTTEQISRRKKAGFWIGFIITGAAFLGLTMLAPPLSGWPVINAIGGSVIACLGGLLGRRLSTRCCMGKDTGDSDYTSLGDEHDIDEEPESQKTRRNISFAIGFLVVGGLTGGLGFAFILPLFTPSYLLWGAYVLGCGFLAFCGGKGTEIAMENRNFFRGDDSDSTTHRHGFGGSTFDAYRAINYNMRIAEGAAAHQPYRDDDASPLDEDEAGNNHYNHYNKEHPTPNLIKRRHQ